MRRDLTRFVDEFVLPLLGGGTVSLRGPIRPKEHRAMLDEIGVLGDARLRVSRLRRAMLVVSSPDLPDPDLDELGLWVGLHNALVLDHPERSRVWARASTWRRVEGMARTLLSLGEPSDLGDAIARHVSVEAFLELQRVDVVVSAVGSEEFRLRGQPLPRRGLFVAGHRARARPERVTWSLERHAPEAERLLDDALWTSPLTCVMRPTMAPEGWSPLSAARLLRERTVARAVCNAWADDPDWLAAGSRITGGLLGSLGLLPDARIREGEEGGEVGPKPAIAALPGTVLPTAPEAVGAVVGALVHLHLVKVLAVDARLGVALGSRDRALLSFLTLPLLLPALEGALGSPLAGLRDTSEFDVRLLRRWEGYVDHLQELVPREIVDTLMATLVPRITERP
jgi:hypothetical protein